jgi:protein ImuA
MDQAADDRRERLHRLRRLAEGAGAAARAVHPCVPTGHAGLDSALGGGLARGRLHELVGRKAADTAATIGFAAALACRVWGPVVWLREAQAERRLRLHGPGLAELGLDPGRLVLGLLPDADAVLRAAADVLRCPDVGLAVIELWGQPRHLGLSATRRFQLAAEESGATALLVRIAAEATPSAATSRLMVEAAASLPLPADAPGQPGFGVELMRHRGGGRGRWTMAWHRDGGGFRDNGGAALPGAVVPASADRPAAAAPGWRRAG